MLNSITAIQCIIAEHFWEQLWQYQSASLPDGAAFS